MFADSISNCGTISKRMTRNKNSLNFSMQDQFDFTDFITALVFRLFYTAQFDRFMCVSCYYNDKEVNVNILTLEIIIFHQKHMFTRHIHKLLVKYCIIWWNNCQSTILNQNVAYHTEIYQEFTCWYDLY